MITRSEYARAQKIAESLIRKTGVIIKDSEFEKIAVADFGLGDLEHFGAQILTLVDTEKIAAKLIAMYAGQILPEHWHPRIGRYEGKEETLRVEWGELFYYEPGSPTPDPRAIIPEKRKKFFQSWHEIVMLPGDMRVISPKTPHWFQAGPNGVVVWSFSTQVLDLQDEFTDPDIQRKTLVREDA